MIPLVDRQANQLKNFTEKLFSLVERLRPNRLRFTVWRCPQCRHIRRNSSNFKENHKQTDDSSPEYFVARKFSLILMYELITRKFLGYSLVHKI